MPTWALILSGRPFPTIILEMPPSPIPQRGKLIRALSLPADSNFHFPPVSSMQARVVEPFYQQVNLAAFGAGTPQGEAVCLSNVTLASGDSFLATVHSAIMSGITVGSLSHQSCNFYSAVHGSLRYRTFGPGGSGSQFRYETPVRMESGLAFFCGHGA
jgi:hypothetical protein